MTLCTTLNSFLTAFTLMTIICIDNTIMLVTLKMSSSGSRFRKNVAIGYLAPAVITLLTMTVEFTADRGTNIIVVSEL